MFSVLSVCILFGNEITQKNKAGFGKILFGRALFNVHGVGDYI